MTSSPEDTGRSAPDSAPASPDSLLSSGCESVSPSGEAAGRVPASGSLAPPGPTATGEAAPRLLAGVMAAIWLAYSMKVPALAARAPPGLTKVATGTDDA